MAKRKSPSIGSLAPLDKEGLERMSRMRWEVRRFLRFGEEVAREAGVTALQYYLLLHTQGFPGREWASIGELAERLQSAPHGVVALVTRCEELGLVRRVPNALDARMVEVHPTAKGRRLLDRLAPQLQSHLPELAAVIEAARD
ncbi:MarR family winged helix-turn-helix transcriptional regulator [Ramlibacter sp.]|uniref:MarR family winged helix-turn-helix transcriptional regulator n=1 Tax=Ramlibacter sp. TaxID=1917967 RepID=UPI003D0C24AE